MVLEQRGEYATADHADAPGALLPGPHALQPSLRKGLDIVHFNAQGPGPQNWDQFHSLARQAAAASFDAEMLLPFGSPPPLPPGRVDLRYLDQNVLYYLIVTVVEMHILPHAAAHAGVFGHLAEEPIQLIDPHDTAAIARFRDVWASHGPPAHEEPDLARFFARATDPDTTPAYHAKLYGWQRELEAQWLFLKMEELNNLSPATASEIWHDRLVLFSAMGTRQVIGRGEDGARRDHPWVQEQLAAMPRFEPALMFRHVPPRRTGLWPYQLPAVMASEVRAGEAQRSHPRAAEASRAGGEGSGAGPSGERRRLPSVFDLLEGSNW